MTNCRVLRALSQTNFPLKTTGFWRFAKIATITHWSSRGVGEPTPHVTKPPPIEFPRHLRDSEKEQLKVGIWHNSCYALRAEIAA